MFWEAQTVEKLKAIPIGIEFFKEFKEKPYYYVDKTLFIKDLLDKGGKVNLFTRPRRFGKTLSLSMIRTYFEYEIDYKGNVCDNRPYFEGLKIMQAGEEYTKHMGQYPVISLSLKSAKQPNFEMAYGSLIIDIVREYDRHIYVLKGDALRDDEKEKYMAILTQKSSDINYAVAIKFLSECLKKYHNKNVIILIDEYDVPLENSYFEGFYNEMVKFIRSLFESSLKTNDALEFAVVTGCLRISKESIFTGLNNLNVNSMLTLDYGEYYGFTHEEVMKMLRDYGLEGKEEEVRQWYDGYIFGNTEVYNPWSVIKYVKSAIASYDSFPRPYWSNTSSNSIVRELIEKSDSSAKKEIENLIAGGTIEKPVHEEITYDDIYKSQDNLWNFLFFTGYLKTVGQKFSGDTIILTMAVPNKEIKYIYENTIKDWFDEKLKAVDFSEFYKALAAGDCATLENIIRDNLRGGISYYDSSEAFYHGFMYGVLLANQDYTMDSNRESGEGRYDLVLRPYDEREPAIIIEIKATKVLTQMEKAAESAINQIDEKHYDYELLEEGYLNILKIGMGFCKKSCRVKAKSELHTADEVPESRN